MNEQVNITLAHSRAGRQARLGECCGSGSRMPLCCRRARMRAASSCSALLSPEEPALCRPSRPIILQPPPCELRTMRAHLADVTSRVAHRRRSWGPPSFSSSIGSQQVFRRDSGLQWGHLRYYCVQFDGLFVFQFGIRNVFSRVVRFRWRQWTAHPTRVHSASSGRSASHARPPRLQADVSLFD